MHSDSLHINAAGKLMRTTWKGSICPVRGVKSLSKQQQPRTAWLLTKAALLDDRYLIFTFTF